MLKFDIYSVPVFCAAADPGADPPMYMAKLVSKMSLLQATWYVVIVVV
jgi:hypothetical protein